VFFAIGVLTYHLYLGFRGDALGGGRERAQVETVRWRLFRTAGKVIRHGRQIFLKISAEALEIFVMIRERCADPGRRRRCPRNFMTRARLTARKSAASPAEPRPKFAKFAEPATKTNHNAPPAGSAAPGLSKTG
jgi:hypothetical protein